jgi:hypothetical protein
LNFKKRSPGSEERKSKVRKLKKQPTMKGDQSKALKFTSSKRYKEEVWQMESL